MNRIPGELADEGQVRALGAVVPVRGATAAALPGQVDVLVRPEGLQLAPVPGGNGIVTGKAFLGSVTRVGVRLSGELTVQVDQPTAAAAGLAPGRSVQISLDGTPVLVAEPR
jgi:TOBE domain